MADFFDPVWAHSGDVAAPDAARVASGFTCGPASPALFNWLFQTLQQALNSVADLGALVPATRQINTTEGVKGGGTLEADRTLSLNIPGLDTVTDHQNSDLIAIYRNDGSVHKKITYLNFIAGLGGEGGIILGGDNIGGAPGEFFSGVDTDTMEFRTLAAGTGLEVETSGDVVTVSFADLPLYT